MKAWKIIEPNTIKEEEIVDEEIVVDNLTKVRITKCLITMQDVLHFNGEIEEKSIVPGSTGIGVICEANSNAFDLQKGKRVYIQPTKECNECYNCKTGMPNKCLDVKIAGEDFDGFLTDFAIVPENKLFILPESVTDFEALFIKHISLALAIVDKLNVQKGDYVAIVGGTNFANILAQLLIYYQAVPILLTDDDKEYKNAKDSGIYYTLGNDDDWKKEVSSITSGRLTEKVVYIADSNIPLIKAFMLCSYNASIVFTGNFLKNNPIAITQAIKKNLNIHCISNDQDNTASSINLIANKAINFACLNLDTSSYSQVPKMFENLNQELENNGKIVETVVEMI